MHFHRPCAKRSWWIPQKQNQAWYERKQLGAGQLKQGLATSLINGGIGYRGIPYGYTNKKVNRRDERNRQKKFGA